MKNIVVLSYYFYPDLSAGSFRNTALVKELSRQLGDQGCLHVITTQPNRYKSYSNKVATDEVWGSNIKIHRVSVPDHLNGFKDQIHSYRVFYNAVLAFVKNKKIDLVYASSSRLFTAYLGKTIAKQYKCPLYLDIRDIFVESMNDVLKKKPIIKSLLIRAIQFGIERPTFRSATHINLVSEGFGDYFKKITKAKLTFYPNGIDNAFIGLKSSLKDQALPKIITYAGNIGEGQGLEKIIPDCAELLGKGYHFKIIGDGGTKHLLKESIKKRNLTNVEILDPVQREDLLEIYRNSDFLFLHLNNYKAFERVLPSKLFEYAASNLPMIAGVGGYAKEFIKKNIVNSFIFKPCDYKSLSEWVKNYQYKLTDRVDFVKKFNRTAINKNMVTSILSYLPLPTTTTVSMEEIPVAAG